MASFHEQRPDKRGPSLQNLLEEVRFWQASVNYNDEHGWDDIEHEAHELSIVVGLLSELKSREGISYKGYEEYRRRKGEAEAEIDAETEVATAWAQQIPQHLVIYVVRYLEGKSAPAARELSKQFNPVELKARFEEFCNSAQVCALDLLRARAQSSE
jgi:hypothetical protein